MAFLAAACVWAAAPARAERVGILALQLADDPTARAAGAARLAAEDLGWEAVLLDAKGSTGEQAAQLERLLEGGARPDALVLAMGRPAEIEPQLRAAQAEGVPVVSVMSGPSPHALFDVAVNEFEVGAQVGMHVLGLMGFAGRLLVARDPAGGDPGARARARVLDAILEAYPAVAARAPPAGPGGAAAAAGDGADAVWAATDELALAADDALRAAGARKGRPLLVGAGAGSQEAFRRIRDPASPLAATVAVPFELMGEAAVHSLADVLAGTPAAEIAPGPVLFMGAVLVDATNVPEEGEWPW